MTRQDTRRRVYAELGLATNSNLATTGYVNTRIDQGQRMVALLTRWSLGTASTQATANQAEYTVPTGRIFYIQYVQLKNRKLGETTERDLYRKNESWRTEKGQPQKWYQADAGRIGLWPKPTGGSGGTLNFWGNMTPTAVSSDTAQLVTPAQFHEALIYYVCRESMERLSEQDPNGAKQARFNARFKEQTAILKSVQRPRSGRFIGVRNK